METLMNKTQYKKQFMFTQPPTASPAQLETILLLFPISTGIVRRNTKKMAFSFTELMSLIMDKYWKYKKYYCHYYVFVFALH